MRKSALLVASFTAMALTLGGCTSNLTGDSYSRDEARTVQTVRMGTIESLRPVK
ncbi:17 kDa surface antigen, partial [Pseudomonas syringae pv. aceris str. M302273]